jgi:hypothetical protein
MPEGEKLNAEAQSSQMGERWFLRRLPWYVVVSVVALLPCFWLPRIEAGDLGSHSYNAWLTSLVVQGQAPGLWLAPQKNNILFDMLLLRLGSLVGFAAGEKIAVCLAVLIFLWGAFAFVSAVAGKPGWFLLPVLLMLAYGWTFHMGFFNFYMATGLSFAGLAILWCARGRWYLYALAAALAGMIWMAHPLGLPWYVLVAAYVLLGRRLTGRSQLLLAGSAAVCLVMLHFYLQRIYPLQWRQGRYLDLLGTGQIFLGMRYDFVGWTLWLAVAGCLLLQWVRARRLQERGAQEFPWLAAGLYVAGCVGLALLPEALRLPWYDEPVNFIVSRFTLGIAVLGCCALAGLQNRRLFAALGAVVAVAYFALVYQDAAKTYRMERHAEELVDRVPAGARIATTIYPFRGSGIFVHHVVDRACIGKCFSVDNYEPSSKAFRLRANPGNRIVAANEMDANHMMIGDYMVRPEDLPLWQVFQCGPKETDLCLRQLAIGPMKNIMASDIQRAGETGK